MTDLVKTDIESYIDSLSVGLLQYSYEKVYHAHSELVRIGKDVIPFIEKKILAYPWHQVKDAARINLLTGYLQLVNELDQERSKHIVNEIRKGGCTPIIEVRIASLLKDTRANFDFFDIKDFHLCISKAIPNRSVIARKVTRWLGNVSKDDLTGINKVLILPAREMSIAGGYIPVICSITIGWNSPLPFPLAWISLFQLEETLYHEIGHHSLKHILGYHPDQEDQANRYSNRLMRKSHPFVGFVFNVFHPFLRKNDWHKRLA